MYDEEIKEMRQELAQISKATFEHQQYLKDRAVRKRDIIIAILLFLLIASNIAWFIYESQMEKVTETTETVTTTTFEDVEQKNDGSGDNNIIGGDYSGKAKN